MVRKLFFCIMLSIAFMTTTGFIGAKGDSPEEKKKNIQKMKVQTLNDLYKIQANAKKEIEGSKGFAVFSNTGVNLLLVSTGNGYGVAHDNTTGKDTYMKMLSGGVGIGLGVKDFRGVFIFSTQEAFRHFVDKGWQAEAQADAAAQADEKGASAAAAVEVAPGVRLYQLTKNGIALQATIQGTKYWKDDELNNK